MQKRYNKPEEYRKRTLAECAIKWRKFKSNLYTEYVRPFLREPENFSTPPEGYDYISQDVWEDFLCTRLSDEFQVINNYVTINNYVI